MVRVFGLVWLAFIALPLVAQAQADEDEKTSEFRGQGAQRVAAWLKVSQNHAAAYR